MNQPQPRYRKPRHEPQQRPPRQTQQPAANDNSGMDMDRYPILTAEEFIAQGTTARAVASIADALNAETIAHRPQPRLVARVMQVARAVASITGQTLPAQTNRRRQ